MRNSSTNSITPEQGKGQAPFSAEVPELLQHHLEHLKASGISIEVIRERGYKSALGKTPLKEAGFSTRQQRAPGILIPLHGVDGTHKVPSLAKLLSVTTRFINKWTSDIRKEREKTRNEEILDLYLQGWTEAEIGKKLVMSQQAVSNILADTKKGINSQIGIPDPPQIGDVWLFTTCDDDYGISGFPGRIPGQIVENLLHFYTKPFDKVVGR